MVHGEQSRLVIACRADLPVEFCGSARETRPQRAINHVQQRTMAPLRP